LLPLSVKSDVAALETKVTLSTLFDSLGELSSCCVLGSIFTSYLSVPGLFPDLNLGLGNEDGKEMLLLRDFNKLLVRDL